MMIGHGLSFTSFAYSNLRVEQQTEARDAAEGRPGTAASACDGQRS